MLALNYERKDVRICDITRNVNYMQAMFILVISGSYTDFMCSFAWLTFNDNTNTSYEKCFCADWGRQTNSGFGLLILATENGQL